MIGPSADSLTEVGASAEVTMDLDQRSEELYEQWVNGNLSDVVDELVHEPHAGPVTRAALAVKLSALMSERERSVLLRLLKDRM